MSPATLLFFRSIPKRRSEARSYIHLNSSLINYNIVTFFTLALHLIGSLIVCLRISFCTSLSFLNINNCYYGRS